MKETDIEKVKQLIYDELFSRENVKYKAKDNWLKMLKDRVPNTYNFIRSLEEQLPQMEDFKDEPV